MKRKISLFLFFILMVSLLALGGRAAPVQANDYIYINSTADIPDAAPGNGVCETAGGNEICTLRAAIQESNGRVGDDVIVMPAGTFLLTRPGNDDTALNGDLDILDDVAIVGVSAGSTIIDGNGSVTLDRVFHVNGDFLIYIQDLAVWNGRARIGGAILNNGGEVVMADSAVADSHSFLTEDGATGAGIHNMAGSELHLHNTLISGNSISGAGNGFGLGGGIFNAGTATLTDSTVTNNHINVSPNGDGGGIYNQGDLKLVGSTVSHNSAPRNGGGITNSDSSEDHLTTLTNSTISGNKSGGDGGGIFVFYGLVGLYNTTIAYNSSDNNLVGNRVGGGIYNYDGSVSFKNSIIANNTREAGLYDVFNDCAGEFNSEDYNLIRNAGCTIVGATSHNMLGTNPYLDVLRDNGGPNHAHTHALLSYSPAVDAGSPNGCTSHLGVVLTEDQRKLVRPIDGDGGGARCDIGAYEAGPRLNIVTPSQVAAGGPAFTLIVSGVDFAPGATVRWNGSARPTTYSNPSRLTAEITAADIDSEGTVTITVINPSNALSNPVSLTIGPAGAVNHQLYLPMIVR